MSIKWASQFNVPWHNRLEVMSTGLYIFLTFFFPYVCLFLIYQFLVNGNNVIRTACIAYLIFVYFDRRCGHNGGRGNGCLWVKKWFIWQYTLNYFPINLVKTVDLPADKHYIFAVFPHGIISTGLFCNMASAYSKWSELFPNIRPKLTTLNQHLVIPICRELFLSLGVCTASYDCLRRLLTQSTSVTHPDNNDGCTSNAAAIIVGGAQEAIHSRPRNYALNLKGRKGFVRVALMTGTSIVPVFSFGEVDIFDQAPSLPGTKWYRFRERVKQITGILPCAFYGRGFFQHNFGLIPRRRPITTVVGAPIEVDAIENPTNDQVDKFHAIFCDEIQRLFDEHKVKYIKDHESVQLVIG